MGPRANKGGVFPGAESILPRSRPRNLKGRNPSWGEEEKLPSGFLGRIWVGGPKKSGDGGTFLLREKVEWGSLKDYCEGGIMAPTDIQWESAFNGARWGTI